MAQTFQIVQRATRTFTTSGDGSNICDYVIGETHLGVSQIDVARTLSKVFRDVDVEAVFVEQPDDLAYDWKPYQRLQSDSQAAIAGLQYQMVKDAKADPTQLQAFLRNVHSDDDLNKALGRLDPSARKRFEDAAAAFDRYNKSAYVSATDYFYVALHLSGNSVPFYNIESNALREKFEARMATAGSIKELTPEMDARDNYMLARAKDILNRYGYHQVVWIVGAQHLDHIRALLAKEGHQVQVVYDSLKSHPLPKIKQKAMVLVHPEELAKIALTPPPPSFHVDQSLAPVHALPKQVTSALARTLRDPNLGLKTGADRDAIVREFAQKSKERTGNQEQWAIKAQLTEVGTIELKRVSRNSYEMSREWPVAISDPHALAQLSPKIPSVAFDSVNRLRAINANQEAVRLLRIQDQGDAFVLYDDRGAEIRYKDKGNDLDVPAIVQYANQSLRLDSVSSIYFELDGFAPGKVDAFETSCQLQQRTLNADRELLVMDTAHGSPGLNDAYFAPARMETTSPAPISYVQSGSFKGFFHSAVQFIAKIAGKPKRLTLEIYARAREHVQEFLSTLRAVPSTSSQSLADRVSRTKATIKKKYNLTDQDLRTRVREELGRSSIVRLFVIPSPGGVQRERSRKSDSKAAELFLGNRYPDMRTGVSTTPRIGESTLFGLVSRRLAQIPARSS